MLLTSTERRRKVKFFSVAFKIASTPASFSGFKLSCNKELVVWKRKRSFKNSNLIVILKGVSYTFWHNAVVNHAIP